LDLVRPAEVRPQKLAEHIADQLRGQIVRRELADGQYLPVEAELCVHFGTSRPTMREAFRILEAEGLLSIRRGGRFGPQVQAPSASVVARSFGLLLQHQGVDLGAVYDTFLDLVPRAAGRLALSAGPAEVAALQAQRDRLAAAADGSSFLEEATEFNVLLVELAGNRVEALLVRLLAEVVQAHRQAMSAYFRARPGVQARRMAEVLASTAEVIRSVEAGDESVEGFLRSALDRHMRKALQVPMQETVQLV
jgi:GntR family transcriptional repressor for pyruvate dehydrogenase complex